MLETEQRNPASMHIDKMTTVEMLRVIQQENENAVRAVGEATEEIAAAIDLITLGMQRGGRLIYVGAGTSGRLGVVDASECPPTYGVSPELVVGVIAGGRDAMFRSSENTEDSEEKGRGDVRALSLRACDTVVGISAAGGASYVLGAMREAKEHGCAVISLTCNPDTPMEREATLAIVTRTGAEVITGSTRMKAGTAQKLVLNMLSTCVMVKTGKVCENLMINLRPTNKKLRGRMLRITSSLTGVSEEEAERLLEANDWGIRRAVDSLG